MASSKLNTSKITEYFPPSPARDEKSDPSTPKQEEEKSDTSVSEILSTSSVFITPNNSPDKDEKKTAASDEDRNKDTESPKEAGCKKTLMEKLNSVAKDEQKTSRPKSRRGRRKKKQEPSNPDPSNIKVNGPAKPKSPRKKKTEADGLKNMLLTDYYPVRRSDRRTKLELEKEKQEDLVKKILSGCEDGLKVVDFENKGRGVVATKDFHRGDFIVEYAGDLISIDEAKEREANYAKDPTKGCYMYYFSCKNKKYCIDATSESGKLGRLLNHSKSKANCHTKQVEVKGKPYLILEASREITDGEELLYDYGDRSREALESHPWLKT